MHPRMRYSDKERTLSMYRSCDIATGLGNIAEQPTNKQVGQSWQMNCKMKLQYLTLTLKLFNVPYTYCSIVQIHFLSISKYTLFMSKISLDLLFKAFNLPLGLYFPFLYCIIRLIINSFTTTMHCAESGRWSIT